VRAAPARAARGDARGRAGAAARRVVLAAAAGLGAAAGAPAQQPRFVESALEVPRHGTRLLLEDVDGDGRRDVVRVDERGVSVHPLGPDGRLRERAEGRVRWPSGTVGWDVADLRDDGRARLVLLVDGTSVVVHEAGAAGFGEGRVLLEGVAGYLPPGVRRLRFARDVDGDGRADLAIPGPAAYRVHLAKEDGFAAPLSIGFEPEIEVDVGDPGRLGESLGQEVYVPWFALRDVDGDGRRDLVSETDDHVSVYLARGDGYPERPSWELDLAALAEDDGTRPPVDLDNLLSFLEHTVRWRVEDLDGEGPADLILQQGGRFRVYRDGSVGPDLERPDQVLKASGNVVLAFLRDTDGDGREDLHIVRAETISLGRVVRLLVVSSSLELDVFGYRNEGGTFARRPTTRRRVEIEIPGLLGFLDEIEAIEDEVAVRQAVPARPLDLDGDGRDDDVVDLIDGEVRLWADLVPEGFRYDYREVFTSIEEGLETLVFERLRELGDEETLTIDLADPWSYIPTPGWDLRRLAGGRDPVGRVPLGDPDAPADAAGPEPESLVVRDVDGDGRGDLIVVEAVDGTRWRVRLFVQAR